MGKYVILPEGLSRSMRSVLLAYGIDDDRAQDGFWEHFLAAKPIALQNIDPVILDVIQKIIDRSIAGTVKYGTTLADNKAELAEWLKHAQEEAMDLANYLERTMQEIRE